MDTNGHIALLGGSFDPVHIGHLRIAISLLEAGFKEVKLIPNYQSPHKKQPHANAQQRSAMLKLALKDNKDISVYKQELTSESPSYTLETLKTMRAQQYRHNHLTWVLGADAWHSLPTWYQADKLLDFANLLIINRPQAKKGTSHWHKQILKTHKCELPQLLSAKYNKIAFLTLPALEISSSEIRAKYLQGCNIQYLVTDEVLDFIQQQGLYKD